MGLKCLNNGLNGEALSAFNAYKFTKDSNHLSPPTIRHEAFFHGHSLTHTKIMLIHLLYKSFCQAIFRIACSLAVYRFDISRAIA